MMKCLTLKDNKECAVAALMSQYRTYVDLLQILRTCTTPIFIFDKKIVWACEARWIQKLGFLSTEISARKKFIDSLKRKFSYSCLELVTCKTLVPGSNSKVNLLLYDFENCFYSSLSDLGQNWVIALHHARRWEWHASLKKLLQHPENQFGFTQCLWWQAIILTVFFIGRFVSG